MMVRDWLVLLFVCLVFFIAGFLLGFKRGSERSGCLFLAEEYNKLLSAYSFLEGFVRNECNCSEELGIVYDSLPFIRIVVLGDVNADK